MGIYTNLQRSIARYGLRSWESVPAGNPNPKRYQIFEHYVLGNYLLVKINYPDCLNYEGTKILLYENTTLDDLISQEEIDPHFTESKKYISPVARFEPTGAGWQMAKVLMENLQR